MNRPHILLFILALVPSLLWATPPWDSRRLTSDFHAEGAGIGDVDGDGAPDLSYGPFWFSGPEFTQRHRFAAGEKVSPIGYSDNFFSFVRDLTGDGRSDIVVFGFPGKQVRLFVNPGPDRVASDQLWPVHTIVDQLSHEAATLIDLIPGGLPEIVGSRDKAYGYYTANREVTQPWTWHPISKTGRAEMPWGHGLGVGDVNGDGRLDVIEKAYWYEQPDIGETWTEHRWALLPYGTGGAQILVDDIDADGDQDLITSLNAHGSGIAWFEQSEPGKFARHDIIGASSTDSPHGVAFREIHGLALADIDGDGLNDFVAGKRWLAHNGRDAGAYQEPVVYWFRKVKSAEGVEFVPHLVDNDSGIGVGVAVGDLNGDKRPEIVSANKRGLAIHFQTAEALAGAAERWKVPGGRPQEGYANGLSPKDALAKFVVPDGFSVDLIASEPEITQPIAMCFDARGRLWVAEGQTYPQRAPEGQGRDRIHIFTDTDGDGSFDDRKVFADRLNLVSGIQLGFGGLYVGAPPYLLYIPDRNADDVPDAAPEILLDGFGYQDTHETLNSFTWGPDGWLYGCHGVFTQSNIGKPGATDKERQRLNAGVWRFHPVRRVFEIFAEGSSNPWGLDFDAHGDAFITACVVPHLYHVSQGGRYTRQAGQHFHPYVFDDIETIADHRHFVGRVSDNAFHGPNRDQPPSLNADTSALGGGHAHCGLAIYQADQFPAAYRGDLFFSNLHGHRLVRERLEREGSGHIARHAPDFALAQDRQFIGVSVIQGPDGALYVSDWQDKQTCHHRDVEIWDRSNGRIYRIRHGAAQGVKLDLRAETDSSLVSLLAHPNGFQTRQAQLILQERAAAGKIDAASVKKALAEFEAAHASDDGLRLRAIWTAHRCGLLAEADLLARLADSSEFVRGWAIQFLGEPKSALSTQALAALEALAAKEASMVTRRYLASLLQRIPVEQRWNLTSALIRHVNDQNDRNIPLLTWYGVEPLVEADPARALTLSDNTAWPTLRDFIARRAALFPAGREALMASLATAPDAAAFRQRATQLLLALESLPPVSAPAGWKAARTKGEALAASDPQVLDVLRPLGARFGDADFFAHWRAVARDAKASTTNRLQAINLLQAGADPELGTLARGLLDETALLPAVIQALRTSPTPETATALVSRIDRFPLEQRNEAINLLAMRPETALVLLQALDSKKLAPSLISPVMLDQFVRFDRPEITAIIERHWTRSSAAVDLKQLAAAIETWKGKLNDRVLAQADASRGRQVFQTTCGICHQLFGEGVALGPDLTGSNRANLAYVLENVLVPSAVVGRDYLLNVVTLQNGSVISGMIRQETPEFLTLALPGGTTTQVKKAEVKSREEMPMSLMPPGLFDALPLNQVADLVKYLASPAQVPLPGSSVEVKPPAPAATGIQIEAEGLRPNHAKVTGGDLRRQEMSGFKNGVWSGGSQLFWVSVQLGHTLTLTLENLPAGTQDVTLFPTLAKDYGRFRVRIGDQVQEADLFSSSFVRLGPPVVFQNVAVTAGNPLQILIEPVGANPNAQIGKYGFVFGLDRIAVSPSMAAKFPQPVSGPLRLNLLDDAVSLTTTGSTPQEVIRFQTKPLPDSGVIVPSVAYFHPIRTPSGIPVTALAPKPHPYYRGLFFGYVDTRGVREANFWGGGGGPIKGSAVVNLDVRPATGSQPSFEATNEWRFEDTALVTEDIQSTAHLDGLATILDLTYTLRAIKDHRLTHCNVGGIALPVRYDGQLTAHGPDGPVKLPSAVYRKSETNWPASPWYGYTMELPEGTVSAAILNHPANPETAWHCALGARVINPCITTSREVVLKAGEPLTLRYRVVALDGAFDSNRMADWAAKFAGRPD